MDNDDFEGTLVLEKLAESGRLEEFWEAVDTDDLETAEDLMLAVGLDRDTIDMVLERMETVDSEH